MGPDSEDDDGGLDFGAAIQGALARASEEEDEDPSLNVISSSGLGGGESSVYGTSDELPYVVLLNAAVTMVKNGDLSMDEYVEGVMKLDAIADNALKVYSIPAVKKDLPGKLTEHQNSLMGGLEAEIHRMKDGLEILLDYPEHQDIGELNRGHEIAVSAMKAMAKIQSDANAEHARIMQEEADKKAQRAQKAAEAEA